IFAMSARGNRVVGGPFFRSPVTSDMGWASQYIAKLQNGETVSLRPRGGSMAGKIESGQLCTVVPVDPATLKVGDVVLCRGKGHRYLPPPQARPGAALPVGNHPRHGNRWVTARALLRRRVRVEPWPPPPPRPARITGPPYRPRARGVPLRGGTPCCGLKGPRT